MKNCSEIMELIGLYIDNELDVSTKSEFEDHLKLCERCKKEYNEQLEIVKLCNSIEDEELPETFKEQLHEKLLKEKQRRNPLFFIKSRNVRIISSIAAVILVVFIARDFIIRDNYSPNSDMKTESLFGFGKGGKSADVASSSDDAGLSNGDVDVTTTEDIYTFHLQEANDDLEVYKQMDEVETYGEGIGRVDPETKVQINETISTNNQSEDIIKIENSQAQDTKPEQEILSVYVKMKVKDRNLVVDIANKHGIKLGSDIQNDGQIRKSHHDYTININIETLNYDLFIKELQSTFKNVNISKEDDRILISLE